MSMAAMGMISTAVARSPRPKVCLNATQSLWPAESESSVKTAVARATAKMP